MAEKENIGSTLTMASTGGTTSTLSGATYGRSRKRVVTFKRILIALAVIVAAFAGVVAMQPAEFSVARSTTIAAPAPVVFAQVNDFHKWDAWNPWAKVDPAMKSSYAGAPAGVGAVYSWAGNQNVGEGRITILDSRPSELVRVKLEFFEPFAATNFADFTFEPAGSQTAVTWTMTGENSFMAKAIHLFLDMDQMIGGMFEQGLASMKLVSEAASKR